MRVFAVKPLLCRAEEGAEEGEREAPRGCSEQVSTPLCVHILQRPAPGIVRRPALALLLVGCRLLCLTLITPQCSAH